MSEQPDKNSYATEEPVTVSAQKHVLSLKSLADAAASGSDLWLELAKLFCIVVVLALCERTFLFQPYNIPSGSMQSTLLVGDYLFVEKFAYGYSRYSVPWGRYMPSFGRVLMHAPQRGDVVVFVPPSDPDTVYIKRLVGLPGDQIRMQNGVLFINGAPVSKLADGSFADPESRDGGRIAQFTETLPGGRHYDVLDSEPDSPGDNTQTYVVPAGHYFMMGDNRDDSNDSRMDVGFVPAENLVGKAQFRFFSIDAEKIQAWKFWTWPGSIRFERIFTGIR